jgi:hypothetical protein
MVGSQPSYKYVTSESQKVVCIPIVAFRTPNIAYIRINAIEPALYATSVTQV